MPGKKLLLLLPVYMLFAYGFAQNNMQQFIFQHIAEKDGLSNNIINCIAKDRKGFLWIGTFDGLNRFDGTHFITFHNNRHKPNSLLQNSVQAICFDNKDDVWCATETGISCYHQQTQTFENFFPDTGKENIIYWDIVCDAWGTIWCSSGNGIYEYLPKNKTFRRYGAYTLATLSLTANFVHKRGMVLSPDKRFLWIATTKGINHFDIASKTIYNYKNNPHKRAVFDSLDYYPLSFDRNGKLIYGHEEPNVIHQYDFATNTASSLDILFSKHAGYSAPAACIFIDNKNRYWISTWGYTLFMYDPQQKQVNEFFHDDASKFSAAGDFFWDAYQDEEGAIWLGTVNGLSYTNPDVMLYRPHDPFKGSAGIKHLAISRFCEDDRNCWWFTRSYESFLYQYDPSTGIMNSFSWPEKENYPGEANIRGLCQYKIYLLINNALSFNINTHRFDDAPVSLLKKITGTQMIYALKLVHDSVLCLLTERAGIIRYSFSSHNIQSVTPEENPFLGRNINNYRSNTAGINGQWYLAFSQLKLARYDPWLNRVDSIPVTYIDGVGLTGNATMDLTGDNNGNLWMSLKGTGLFCYDVAEKKLTLWQQSEGLVYNYIYTVSMDHNGKIWTAGYNKFSVFDPSKKSFQNFSLPISENNYAYYSRLITLKNGNILGNIDQTFVEWLPGNLTSHTTRQPILINAFKVFDSTISLQTTGNHIKLNYKENFFSIEFGILTGMEKNRYHLQYMLEGFNDKWIDAGPLNTATYTNVPEDDFIFKVRAVAADGSWIGKETILHISVIPPFYRTAWFRIFSAFIFAALIGWLIRLRINNIRKTEEQKNEFNKMVNEWRLKALRSQMNPHFIFNCMNSIDLYILKNDAENASRYLNKFAKLVRLILNHSDEMTIPLAKEMEMLKYYIELEALRFDKPFYYSIKVDDSIDTGDTEIPSMLLQPYIENAILHGLRHKKEQGHLLIAIKRSEKHLHCTIEDDGVGRSATKIINEGRTTKHESKGMKLTEERLQMMDAQNKNKAVVNIIDLTGEDGHAAGTRVEIEIAVEFDD
jgi:ligand-binding sensor domain-containing protein